MGKILNVLIVMAIFAVSAAVGFFATLNHDAKIEASTTGNIVEGKIYEITLLADRAEPDVIIIKLGEFVQFNSRDGGFHDISYGKENAFRQNHSHGGGLESGRFGPDEGYKIQFKETGIYHFHDHLNPKIFATIIVYDPSDNGEGRKPG